MTRRGNPILVEYCPTATMSTWKTKKRCSSYRHLPRPPSEWRIFAADDPSFRPREQRWHATLHILTLFGSRDRHHRTCLLVRLHADSRCFWCYDDTHGTWTGCTIRSRHCCCRCDNWTGCTANSWCNRCRCTWNCGFLCGSRPSWSL